MSSSSGDEFGRAVAKIGVAQICESVGFHAIQRSAAEALADIALRYLSDLARAAHFYANQAGRTECNALDAVAALEDVSPASAAESSRALHDFARYVEIADEVPFARSLPHFPVPRRRASAAAPSFAQLGEAPPHAHIPAWLPAFPDAHTYRATPVWDERRSDQRVDKLELTRQRRKSERSLVSLQMHLASGGAEAAAAAAAAGPSEGPARQTSGILSPTSRLPWAGEQAALLSRLETESGKGKGKRVAAAWQNPFLASPLPAGEREVSAIPFPGRAPETGLKIRDAEETLAALPSVLDTFSAAIETAKRAPGIADPRSAGASAAGAEGRRPMFLSFDWSRKARRKVLSAQQSVGGFFDRSPEADGGGIPAKEEVKDDRKRRAEQILARSYDDGVEDASQP